MSRRYRRDRRGRFARRPGAGKAARRGAIVGGLAFVGGPGLIPLGAAAGAAAGYAANRARHRRR